MDPNRPPRCTAIGECMIELRSAGPGLLATAHAGDTFNTIYYLNALLRPGGARLRYCTALGEDEFSAAMRAGWQALGIDTALVFTLPGKLPGLYRVSTDERGERRFDYWRSDSAARRLLDCVEPAALGAALAGDDLVYLSGVSLAILSPPHRAALLETLAACKRAGIRLAIDDNYRPRLWEDAGTAREWIGRLLALADIALVSFDDQHLLFGDADPAATARRLRAGGIDEVVVRNGAEPAWVANAELLAPIAQESPPTVIDTTGAGDAFNAAYLAARLGGAEPARAMRAGNRLAAIVVGVRGAIVPPASVPALEDLLSAG